MKAKEADLFEISEEQLEGMYVEIGLLSKKKPDGPVNKFKLKFINELLEIVNDQLGANYLPLKNFTGFNEDDLPTASDVVFVLSQYLKSMDKFWHDNTDSKRMIHYWILDDGEPIKKTKK